MHYIVAVSGGVDSVVLLDMLVHKTLQGLSLQGAEGADELVVAHFDHGIRPESGADARFVEGLARYYSLPFEGGRESLGSTASEALAREHRYNFLYETAAKYNATIITAHHQDDLIETIAINLVRGTGWRGLAVFGNSRVSRPLLGTSKQALYDYACRHNLEWVEDETNASGRYLRNRLRRAIHTALDNEAREQLVNYWHKQTALRQAIEQEANTLITPERIHSRYFFGHIDETSALELLRTIMGYEITRPQARRLLHAVKTARPGTICEVGGGHTVRFTARDFTTQSPSEMLL